jgi:glycosyltransferase involved in cell wall biosynthesis
MSEAASSITRDPTTPTKWIALLGRQDMPTDGVEDYCTLLGEALRGHGIELKQARVSWMEKGWTRALRQLLGECTAWRGRLVLMQYTAFTWSQRGFPLAALLVFALVRRSGARVAVVFHEPCRQGGARWIDRLRGACQDWVIRGLYRRAAKSIFTVPIETITWLPKDEDKAEFIPIGANVPQRVNRRFAPGHTDREKTVIVFGVTEAPIAAREAEEIAAVMKGAIKILTKLRLIVVGRGSLDAKEPLKNALKGSGVDVAVRGVLPAEEISREFERADVQLFVRGAISLQRGSALAGIACGLPIVGYHNGEIGGPLKEAGVEWSPWRDRDGLVRGLIRVLGDPQRWMELHERNLRVQENHLSWSRIADRYRSVFPE